MNKREIALEWWNKLSFENKFCKTIEANEVLIGDTVDNHPDNLTGRDIELVYNFHLQNIKP